MFEVFHRPLSNMIEKLAGWVGGLIFVTCTAIKQSPQKCISPLPPTSCLSLGDKQKENMM